MRQVTVSAVPAVKAAVLADLPDIPLRNIRTMDEVFGRGIAQRRLNMLLLGLFGLLGLVISAVGIYGVMAMSSRSGRADRRAHGAWRPLDGRAVRRQPRRCSSAWA
jgi:hypothetical protein